MESRIWKKNVNVYTFVTFFRKSHTFYCVNSSKIFSNLGAGNSHETHLNIIIRSLYISRQQFLSTDFLQMNG